MTIKRLAELAGIELPAVTETITVSHTSPETGGTTKVEPEVEKADVPACVKSCLKAAVKQQVDLANEKDEQGNTHETVFHMTGAAYLEEILNAIEAGTTEDIKRATMKFTSGTNSLQNLVPKDVSDFLMPRMKLGKSLAERFEENRQARKVTESFRHSALMEGVFDLLDSSFKSAEEHQQNPNDPEVSHSFKQAARDVALLVSFMTIDKQTRGDNAALRSYVPIGVIFRGDEQQTRSALNDFHRFITTRARELDTGLKDPVGIAQRYESELQQPRGGIELWKNVVEVLRTYFHDRLAKLNSEASAAATA